MRLSVCKSFTFDAAHCLPGYKGSCANLHGHRWVLEVEVSGNVDEDTGMVIDFSRIKKLVNNHIIDDLDHNYLNTRFDNPTAETMVESFVVKLRNLLDDMPIRLERIRLYETPTSFCEWKNSIL